MEIRVVPREVTMQDGVFSNMGIVIPILLALIGVVVVYLVLMGRAIIEMLRSDVHGVFLVFAFLALIPVPPFLVLGIMILIIWHYHKTNILAGGKPTR